MAVRIWLASVDAFDTTPARSCLSAAELERADGMPSLQRRRFLGRRWMARTVLSEATGRDPRRLAVEARCERCGGLHPATPLLVGSREVWWSASSSDGLAAVALSPHRVGLDVERLGCPPHWERIAERFYGETERHEVAGSASRFLEFWTLKEAFLKATGLGLAGGLRSFDCSGLSDAGGWRTSAAHPGWRFQSIRPQNGFVGAVAVEGSPDKIELHSWTPPLGG